MPGDFGFDPYLVPVGEKLDRFASMAPGPEELLLQREAHEAGEGEEVEAEEQPWSAKLLPRLHAALAAIPPDEAEVIVGYFAGEQHQRDIAARLGMTQPGVHWRIKRALRRMKWLTGPGSWFTAADIERDLRDQLTPNEILALSVYWTTTSIKPVQIRMGTARHGDTWNFLHKTIAKLTGRYRRGFDELVAHGNRVLIAPTRPKKGNAQ